MHKKRCPNSVINAKQTMTVRYHYTYKASQHLKSWTMLRVGYENTGSLSTAGESEAGISENSYMESKQVQICAMPQQSYS